MNHDSVIGLSIEFRHPGEAALILRSIIHAYEVIKPEADAEGIPELSAHISQRLDDLSVCLAQAEFDLAAEEAHPPGRA